MITQCAEPRYFARMLMSSVTPLTAPPVQKADYLAERWLPIMEGKGWFSTEQLQRLTNYRHASSINQQMLTLINRGIVEFTFRRNGKGNTKLYRWKD